MTRSVTLDRLLHTLAPDATARASLRRAVTTGRWDAVPWFQADDEGFPTLEPGTRVLGRYDIVGELGAGGFGTVFGATDTLTGDRCAIKAMVVHTAAERALLAQEADTLRVLNLPGVVDYLDHALIGDGMLIAMAWVDGAPFPGPGPTPWDDLAERYVGLLETIARVHAVGVVHRDLKPANVLCTDDGRPVVLDFGIARRQRLGCTVDEEGVLTGTPAYLAPEQVFGGTPDARTDLYALGVILYEALSGVLPFPGDDLQAVLTAKLDARPAPLPRSVPEAVRETVMAMMAPRAEHRPASAGAVVRALRRCLPSREDIAWLGGTTRLDDVAARLAAGRSVRVVAPPGRGRTRFVDEVADRLHRRGVRPWVMPDDGGPLRLLKALSKGASGPLASAQAAAAKGLVQLSRAGRPALIDGDDTLATGTRVMLDGLPDDVVTLRVGVEPRDADDVVLPPLTEAELFDLIVGPERFHHVRSDGARLLHARTAGEPGRVADEVGAWVRAGLATWEDGRVRTTREGLGPVEGGLLTDPAPGRAVSADQLSRDGGELLTWLGLTGCPVPVDALATALGTDTWQVQATADELVTLGLARLDGDALVPSHALPFEGNAREHAEARAALAAALPPGTHGRLALLVSLGEIEQALDEAVLVTGRSRDAGDLPTAWTSARTGLALARRGGTPEARRAIAVEAADTALSAMRRAWIVEAAHDVGRLGHEDIGALLTLSLRAMARDATAAPQIEALPPLPEVQLRCWQHATGMFALAGADAAARKACLARIRADVEHSGTQRVLAGRILGWTAEISASEGDYGAAAERHLESVGLASTERQRVAGLAMAAMRALDAGQCAWALELATRFAQERSSTSVPILDAMVHEIVRSAHYRLGRADPLPTGPEHIDEYEGLAPWGEVALVTSAAYAWRQGRDDLAACVEAMASLAPSEASRLLVTALSATTGGPWTAHDMDTLGHAARRTPHPGIALQLAALHRRLGGDPSEVRDLARRSVELPASAADQRREVLSIAECLDTLHADPA
ncbi:MAG: serine/threonine protein kinase [Alphaproteobacteria bacterium]|nr:serine/threonine protein kinase [Alphaproteobacteria bacterium]